jgi:hypothetical protein
MAMAAKVGNQVAWRVTKELIVAFAVEPGLTVA